MTYRIEDLQIHFSKKKKPLSRSTIHRWIKRGVINKPDIGGDGNAHPIWLSLPVKSNSTTNPSA